MSHMQSLAVAFMHAHVQIAGLEGLFRSRDWSDSEAQSVDVGRMHRMLWQTQADRSI